MCVCAWRCGLHVTLLAYASTRVSLSSYGVGYFYVRFTFLTYFVCRRVKLTCAWKKRWKNYDAHKHILSLVAVLKPTDP